MTIEAGRLRRNRITIEQESSTQDELGQPVPTWTTVAANLPAEILGVGGGETIRGQQVDAGITSVVTIRYRSGLSPKMRIVHNSRNLNIAKVNDPDGFRRELLLHCSEEST